MTLISLEEAQSRVLEPIERLGAEDVPLDQCLGRVLAESLVATRSQPPADNSAMDGYAMRWADLQAIPDMGLGLRVVSDIQAGGWSDREIGPGEAARIMTGAPVPPGEDLLVIMRERVDESTEGIVRVFQPGDGPGQNIRLAGEDIDEGDVLFETGHCLQAADLGIAASQGLTSLRCVRRPVVAILSTGDEVQLPGDELAPGHIYCSNSFALAALTREAGCEPRFLGIARDRPESLREHFARAEGADAIVTIGGVSMGDYDHVKEVAEELGAEQSFWKVAMRPGKPNAYGTLMGIPWWGLPGNPVSSMVSFLQYVRPALRKMQGCPKVFLPTVDAVLEEDIRSRAGFLFLYRGQLSWDVDLGTWTVCTTGPQGSGIMSSMSAANCLISVPEDVEELAAGDRVKVQLLPQLGAAQGLPGLR